MSVLVPARFPSLSTVFMAAALAVLLLLVARVLFLLLRLWAPDKDALHWNTLPASLPFSLSFAEKPSDSAKLNEKQNHMLPVGNWQPRTGPQFQHPPPALYESPVPLSMAKMIMSRHTFRRPNPNRSRKSSSASPSRPTAPPQTPSRLYHSIA